MACGSESPAKIEVIHGVSEIILKCKGPVYMDVAVWYIDDHKITDSQIGDTLVIHQDSLSNKDKIVTCLLKSIFTNKIARDAIVLHSLPKFRQKEMQKDSQHEENMVGIEYEEERKEIKKEKK